MSFFKSLINKISSFGQQDDSEQDSSIAVDDSDQITEADIEAYKAAEEEQVDRPVDEEFLKGFEEELIRSDLGVSIALDFVEKLRAEIKKETVMVSQLQSMLKSYLLEAFGEDRSIFNFSFASEGLTVLMVLGVNGVGKTTSIAKLAKRFNDQGRKVLLAAGDTFRAAAEDQLRFWAERAEVDFIDLPHGSKSSAVVYKAIEKAKAEGHDTLVIDTAGRLHNKKNLMEELSKIKQVIEKNLEGDAYSLETMLVLDSSMGQNAVSQAETFKAICDVNSIILSKFDGSAKAGAVFAIAHKLKLPVKFLGTGEKIENIEVFNPDNFVAKYF